MSENSFFPMDLLMDSAMLAAAQLSLSAFSLTRLVCAQLLLSFLTLASLRLEILQKFHLPLFIICAAAATGERRPGRILEAAAAMFCAAAACAGFALMGGHLAAPIAGCALLTFLLRRHRHLQYKWDIEIQIAAKGRTISLPALIDTGNRLKEHSSGLPVLIVESQAAPDLNKIMADMDETQIHRLPYGVLGSSGEIACFLPDNIHILTPHARPKQAPPCYVAVFPGRIPGRTCALAPPEFAEVIEDHTGLIYRFHKRARRVLLWRFQM